MTLLFEEFVPTKVPRYTVTLKFSLLPSVTKYYVQHLLPFWRHLQIRIGERRWWFGSGNVGGRLRRANVCRLPPWRAKKAFFFQPATLSPLLINRIQPYFQIPMTLSMNPASLACDGTRWTMAARQAPMSAPPPTSPQSRSWGNLNGCSL